MLRGYHEQDVDDFLDEITEELALLLDEVRQLRERAGAQPLSGGQEVAEAKRSADEIVLRAREEASEIVRRARTEAAGSGAGDASALSPFLAQERTFLQDLSKLIQGHADTVRDLARARGRGAARPQPPASSDSAGDEAAHTVEVGEAETDQESEPAEDRA
jgi:cell division septum initiation protein DivIVA